MSVKNIYWGNGLDAGHEDRRRGNLGEATSELSMNLKQSEKPFPEMNSSTLPERKSFAGSFAKQDQAAMNSSTISTRGTNVKRELESLATQMHSTGVRYEDAVRQFKRQYLIEVLRAHRGNQCKAADELGMHRNTLSRTMAELDLEIAEVRAGLKRPVRSERLIQGGLRQQVR